MISQLGVPLPVNKARFNVCNKHVGDFPLRVICPKLVRELFWF